MLLNKRIIIVSIFFVLFSSVVIAQTCEVAQVRNALRKSLFDYLTDPSKAIMSLPKIKDLLIFYLSIDPNQNTVDCGIIGVQSNEQIVNIVAEAFNITGEVPKCTDNTEYGECSLTKPSYCYNGNLINKCSMCGCSTGICDNMTESCIEVTQPINVTTNVTEPTCTDTDGGINYYENGTLKVNYPNGTVVDYLSDYCSFNTQNLIEYYCTNDQSLFTTTSYLCPNGCLNRACISNVTQGSCTDTDGGINYSIKGEVTFFEEINKTSLSIEDSCDANNLTELYCNEFGAKDSLVYNCKTENGNCIDGACVESTTPLYEILPVVTNTATQYNPDIYGDRIVWQDNRNGNWDIYMYDLLTNQEIQITNSTLDEINPIIYENKIVWNGYNNIYMYDLLTNQEIQITNIISDKTRPYIYENVVVWEDYRHGNADIYMYDSLTNQEARITTNTANQRAPVVYGNRIVWYDNRNGSDDIYLYDLSISQEIQVTTHYVDQTKPSIYGDRIVAEDSRDGHVDIYMYDISTGEIKQITSHSISQKNPEIYSDRIVYSYDDDGIYMYDLSTNIEIPLTLDRFEAQRNPKIYDNKIVWEDRINGNWDIYITTIN